MNAAQNETSSVQEIRNIFDNMSPKKFLKEVEITKWKIERLLNEYNFTLEYYTKENFKIHALTLWFWSTSRIVGLKS